MKSYILIFNLLLTVSLFGQYGDYKLPQPQVVKLNQKGTTASRKTVTSTQTTQQVQQQPQVQSQPTQYNQPQSSLPVFNPITINLQKCDLKLVEKVWINLIESYQEKVVREKTNLKMLATNMLSRKPQSNLISNCLIPEIGGTTYLDVSFEIKEESLTFSVTLSQAQYSQICSSFGSADNLIQTFLKNLKIAILDLQIANQTKRGSILSKEDNELTNDINELQSNIDKYELKIYEAKNKIIEKTGIQEDVRNKIDNNKKVLNELQIQKSKIKTEHVSFM